MDFSSAADELYGVRPAEFVATRKRLVEDAKAAGDAPLAKRVGALRRPTLSAWAVNLLARSAADDLGRLLDVGDEIRAAWGSGGGLGDLEQRRARLVGALVRTAGDLAADAGTPLREQAVREVEDTLQGATVDAGIADEVRAGRLARPRSHTGFVPAGFPMTRQEERPRTAPEPEEKPPADKKRKKKAAPERAVSNVTRTSAARARRAETLRRRAEEADRKLSEREGRADTARWEAAEASARVGRLRHELERALAERDAATRRAERAEENRARAEVAAREAREAAREARRAADRDARHG
ncbi:hypothetical protein BZB76_6725 [Actinomadura pelletieri DSM 43383]|uniref:Uncharacterized protein n=1 Tax=Actinomadura pelletieri DSM 43383 TaxID=1120940 RepID=A0A495Q8Y1_9ACTN|nr:hypothetical protein [Actinomadura pelletieri]RKS67773.1 hypothetical protein BZB76_6725 [Actinomadura pelletieri DSM 43383]